jgi:hypothetical protein
MDLESVRARRGASALAGKPAPPPIDRTNAVPRIAGAECETLARDVLLEQPGVAAVEEVRVKKRWGRLRSVTACITIQCGVDARDVCRCAAQALGTQLRVADVCLVTAVAPGEIVSQERTL